MECVISNLASPVMAFNPQFSVHQYHFSVWCPFKLPIAVSLFNPTQPAFFYSFFDYMAKKKKCSLSSCYVQMPKVSKTLSLLQETYSALHCAVVEVSFMSFSLVVNGAGSIVRVDNYLSVDLECKFISFLIKK